MDDFDTFDTPRHQNDRNRDVEMGTHRPMNSGELGLEDFFKKAHASVSFMSLVCSCVLRYVFVSVNSKDAHEESKSVTKAAAMKGKAERFGDSLGESTWGWTLMENINHRYREVVENEYSQSTVTNCRADEETIDRLIETGDSEQIFQKAIVTRPRTGILRYSSVGFDAQGDMLDNVESQKGKLAFGYDNGYISYRKQPNSGFNYCRPCAIRDYCSTRTKRNYKEFKKMDVLCHPPPLLIIVSHRRQVLIKPWQSDKGA
ncbi:hypothetical protein HAX54_032022 [Datura stramonium]|uniref:Syntaxin N-terminal domain-containing protein n=1 Tax=Datura stramonium TaxID=4076 RepID=A0ABS8VCY6_DATST|nr:hypothetical protein [Datura stramonium]